MSLDLKLRGNTAIKGRMASYVRAEAYKFSAFVLIVYMDGEPGVNLFGTGWLH